MSDKAASSNVHTPLMREMGSPSGQWDPFPPTQHEAFLDVTESPKNRVWGAIIGRTMGYRSENGRRSPFAREEDGRVTQQTHLAAALDMHKSEVSEQLATLETEGKIKMLEGKIWLRADVPQPNRQKAKKEQSKVHCTVNFNEFERKFLLSLEQSDPDTFRVAAKRIVGQQLWAAFVKAEAMAWARERDSETWQQVFTEIGYTTTESRGAKKKRPATPGDALRLPQNLDEFTVRNSVEIEEAAKRFTVRIDSPTAYGEDSNSVQTPHPYRREAENLRGSASFQGRHEYRTKAPQAELEADVRNRALKNELKTELTARLRAAKLLKLGALPMDVQTQNTIVSHLAGLTSAGAVRQVLDVLEQRANDLATGKRAAASWGYLVNIVKAECEKRSGAKDLKTSVASAAAGKMF